ncbi:hypothetical protein F2Q69_00005183 [Brassica cretica]|uniref:DNA mismatch repair proteins mutS family domain-containing protein n=1 Tax=Brassica cretica TaxID=69181 RepID=A0A8S9PJY9_BRACR|nr:hypothetical protein F2Q69_00005183 [Brassica cretica]
MAAAAHTFLSFSSPPRLLVSPSSTLRSSFGGVSLNLHRRQSVSFSASSKKSLTVVSAAKKAVAVLKGNSDVEGVVTLTQEDTGPFSILILDVFQQVRSGTNPLEGAALEMAILESFAESGSLLTWQPHITESLRCLNTAILAFENACMEFDDLNLKPTFKILWGVPGRPNAINIAERLGLPCDIINSARGLYGSASAEINEVILDMERYKQDYQRLLNESHRYIR